MLSIKINRHRLLVSLIAVLVTATLIPGLPAGATEQEVIEVPLGEGRWWDGEHVQNATMFWEGCGVAQTCWDYYLDVPEGGTLLRVGMDFKDRESRFAIRVRKVDAVPQPLTWNPVMDYAPDHTAVYTGATTLEAWVENPTAGRYLVTVAAIQVVDDTFRMRAILDEPPSYGQTTSAERSTPRPLLPNAVAVPPFNLTFDGPVDGGGMYEPPTYGTVGLKDSCTEDEKHLDEVKPVVCLRFAAGGFNIGKGTLSIKFDADATTGPATQFLDYTDGKSRPYEDPNHAAGTFQFHQEHRHFHYSEAITYSLHEVLDQEQGITEQVGNGRKTSYCMVDYTIADWSSTDQDRRTMGANSNCGSPDNRVLGGNPTGPNEGRIGWSRGWGDMYPWWRQGQYVEFSGAGRDGLYLLRSQVNPQNKLLESNYDDNVAYTLFRIDGYGTGKPTFEYVERGRGEGPWDPDKKVLGPEEETWTY